MTQALARAARRLQPTYAALVACRPGPVVAQMRPAGAWVARRLAVVPRWNGMTVNRIAAGRGFDAAAVPGADYAGVLMLRQGGRRVVAAVEERLVIDLATAETAPPQSASAASGPH